MPSPSEESLRADLLALVESKDTLVFDEVFPDIQKAYKKEKKKFGGLYNMAILFIFGSPEFNKTSKTPVELNDAQLAKLRTVALISLSRNPFAKELSVADVATVLDTDEAGVTAAVSNVDVASVSDGKVVFSECNWKGSDLRSFKDMMSVLLDYPLPKSIETAISKAKDDILEVVNEASEIGIALEDKAVSDTTRHLMYEVGTTFPKEAVKHRKFFLGYVKDEKVLSSRNSFYKSYFKRHFRDEAIDAADFEKECGIGVEVSEDAIKECCTATIADMRKEDAELGWSDRGKIIKEIKERLKFADPKLLNTHIEKACVANFGDQKNAKKRKPKKAAKAAAAEDPSTLPDSVKFPDPSENILLNAPEVLAAHLKRTGGKVMTRFPPEPNGFLHIGHAKSMNLNFGYARKMGGHCYMRFDDTNPAAEKQEYVDSILRSVEWLGHTPYKITYSSDHFDTLFDFAVALIKKDKAFVCHQSAADMQADRKSGTDSPYRYRPVEESLKLFYDMRAGKFAEGEAMLRMKGDMKDPNPNMRDMVAYRILYKAHPHAGDKWCIYPTYDYTHCICDSLEDITHSLCTLEFDVRKKSYQWLLHELDLYCPPQLEFSRLNVTNFTMSKRKLTKLVSAEIVNGWDDPRLPTIEGLRRRGYTADAINNFCEKVGVTRSDNLISIGLLEECVRSDLEEKVKRVMAVLDPLKVTLTNMGDDEVRKFNIPFHPSDEKLGKHETPMSKVIYIERADFSEKVGDKNFFRLTPEQAVGLKYSDDSALKCTKVVTDCDGKVKEIEAEIVSKSTVKVRSHIHWVSSADASVEPESVEVRWYNLLFLKPDMAEVKDYLSEVNPDSLIVYNAFVDPALATIGYDWVQFERNGFFCKDLDYTDAKPVWNLTVTLKSGK